MTPTDLQMLVHSYSTAVSLLLSHCISEFFKANGESEVIAGRFFVMRHFKRGHNIFFPPGSYMLFVQEIQCELGYFGYITRGNILQ